MSSGQQQVKLLARKILVVARDLRNQLVGQAAHQGLAALRALMVQFGRVRAAFEEACGKSGAELATLDARADAESFERAAQQCLATWNDAEQMAGLPSERRAVTMALAAMTRSFKEILMKGGQQQHQAAQPRQPSGRLPPQPALAAVASPPPATAVTVPPPRPFANLSLAPATASGAITTAAGGGEIVEAVDEEDGGDEPEPADDDADEVATASQTVVRMSVALDALQRALAGAGLSEPVYTKKKPAKKQAAVPDDLRAWLSAAPDDDGALVSRGSSVAPPVSPADAKSSFHQLEQDLDGGSSDTDVPEHEQLEAPAVPAAAPEPQSAATPPQWTDPAVEKQLHTRTLVAKEILETEQSFLDGLLYIKDTYWEPFNVARQADAGLVSEEELKVIFGGVDAVVSFSQKLLARLEQQLAEWSAQESTLGGVFEELAGELGDVFSEYVRDFALSDVALKECFKRGPFAFRYAKMHAASVRRNDLQDLLITPVQKHTPEGHADLDLLKGAILALGKAASRVNEAGRFGANFQKLRDVEALVQGLPVALAPIQLTAKDQPNRQFILEDDFTRMEDARRVRLFLFSDLLLVVKYASRYGRLKRKVTRRILLAKLPSTMRHGGGSGGSSGGSGGGGSPAPALSHSADAAAAPGASSPGGGGQLSSSSSGSSSPDTGSSSSGVDQQLPFKFLYALSTSGLRAEGSQELAVQISGLGAPQFHANGKSRFQFVLVAKTGQQRQLWLEELVKSAASAVVQPKDSMVLAMVRACLGRASAGVEDYKAFMKAKYEQEHAAEPDAAAGHERRALPAAVPAPPPPVDDGSGLPEPPAPTEPAPFRPNRLRAATMPSPVIPRPKPLPRRGPGEGSAVRAAGGGGLRGCVADLVRLVREVKPALEDTASSNAALTMLADSLGQALDAVSAQLVQSGLVADGQPLVDSVNQLMAACRQGHQAFSSAPSLLTNFLRSIAENSRKVLGASTAAAAPPPKP